MIKAHSNKKFIVISLVAFALFVLVFCINSKLSTISEIDNEDSKELDYKIRSNYTNFINNFKLIECAKRIGNNIEGKWSNSGGDYPMQPYYVMFKDNRFEYRYPEYIVASGKWSYDESTNSIKLFNIVNEAEDSDFTSILQSDLSIYSRSVISYSASESMIQFRIDYAFYGVDLDNFKCDITRNYFNMFNILYYKEN